MLTIGLWNFSASVLSSTSIHLTWVTPCHTQQYHIYYSGRCGSYLDEGRLDTDRQEYTLDGLQEGVNYSFTVNQTGFSGGRVLSTGSVYARTFTAGKPSSQYCTEHIANELQNEYHRMQKHANSDCFNHTVITCLHVNKLKTQYNYY